MAEKEIEEQLFPGSNFLRGATGMPVFRQLILMIALAASIAGTVAVVFWMQEEDYRPLGSAMNPAEVADMINALELRQIPYEIDQQRGLLSVPAARLYDARMALAEDDVIGGLQKGYELMSEDPGFGVSQSRENAIHRMSREGELARSIMSIQAVQNARVILAVPKASNFIRDRRKPSASVHVSLKPGRNLSPDQVRAITNLVASGVAELDPADVVVVNQSGTLLSSGAEDMDLLRSERDLRLVGAIEGALYDKVDSILSRWVGKDRFTAEVHAEVDFTRAESTEEIYDPEQTAIRSEQQLEEQRVGEGQLAQGVPGALTNQPPEFNEAPAAEEGQAGPEPERQTKVQTTRNFEVDRTLRHTKNSVGEVTRLTVSVLVDNKVGADAETGEATSEAWTPEELQQLEAAVRSAVGFREERGDVVSVVNQPFYRAPEMSAFEVPLWEQAWFASLLRQVLGGLAIIVIIFGLLRPLFRNLSQAGELVREQQSMAIADMTQMREAALLEAVPGLPTPITLDPDESSAEKMETVRNLVLEDPERVAQVVKYWVAENE